MEPLIWGISEHVSTVSQGMFHRQVPWDMERVKSICLGRKAAASLPGIAPRRPVTQALLQKMR